jgi:uncharacterized protein (TIGR02246 family)
LARPLAAALGAALLLGACVHVRVSDTRDLPATPDGARTEAVAILEHGAAAWNRGDLAGFMDDYAVDATFVTSQGLVHGREAIRARYGPRFQPGGVRDSLWFRDIEARPVAEDVIQVVAWWNLSRGDSLVAHGPTSLLLIHADGRWRILYDHSS